MEKPAGHVFISYIREDAHHVDQLQQILQAAGVSVWRDTADLWPGEDWRMKIRRAITDNALVFIACFSSQSAARATSYQNEEVLLAIEQLRLRRPGDPWLIPVRFDDCPVPDFDLGGGRTLTSIQRVDLFGDRRDAEAARLVIVVLRLLGQRPGQDTDPGHESATATVLSRRPSASPALQAARAPNEAPAFTAQWRGARGFEGSATIRSTERIFDHPAYRPGAAEPPAFLISSNLPCQPLGNSQPGPDGMRRKFGSFLARPAFGELIAEAGQIGPGCSWRPMAGRGRMLLESHLCASTQDPDQFPVASVKLILPDRDVPAVIGSEPDRADLLVRINLAPQKVGLQQWRERFARALTLPGHLAAFLTDDLNVPTVGRSAEACVRITARQESSLGLAEVVDVSMFETLPAPYVSPEFRECQVAEPDGNEITTAARTVSQKLAETLHVTGYEEALADLSDHWGQGESEQPRPRTGREFVVEWTTSQ